MLRLAAIVGALPLITATMTPATDIEPQSHLVVVLYPQNNDGSPGAFSVDQSIRAVFTQEATEHIEIHNEYLDITSPTGGGDHELQQNYLTKKYAGRRVDVVIAGLSSALDFILRNRDVFPGAPVVFCAVDEREIRTRTLPKDVIGVPVKFDLQGTLELALRLHPETNTVAVVAGSAPMDRAWEQSARHAFQPYEKSLTFRYLTGSTLEKLVDDIASLPPHSLVYYLHFFNDRTGKTFVPAHVLETLARSSKVPIYGHVDTYVGRGIVGGRVFSFEQEGRNAARLGLRLIAGEAPEQIGVQAISSNMDLFDDRQLKQWRIAEADLPEGSIVRHRQPIFWEVYKWQIAAAGLIFCLQSFLIAGLLVQRARRRRAEENVRTSQGELQQLSDRLIGAQENERRRIARELHDDFNQRLALLAVELDIIRQKPPASVEELRRRMGAIAEHARELSTSIHDLSHELHPLKLEQLGLVTAIRSLCQEFAHSHELEVDFAFENVPEAIPAETALCLYRIVQEALRNVFKHSGAAGAAVKLITDANEIRLTISDQGTGFDSGPASPSGLGLISMRERLRLVHGEIAIDSCLSQGTRITVRVPLPDISRTDREKAEPVTIS